MKFYPKTTTNRVDELDFLRGIAIVCMVIYHWFSLLDLRIKSNYTSNPLIIILGYIARVLFILLVGSGTVLSQQKSKLREDNGQEDEKEYLRRQFTRVGFLVMYALLLTLVTMYVYPDVFIRFGILHYMAVALSLLTLFAYKPQTIPKFVPLIVGIGMFFIYLLSINKVSSNPIKQFIVGYRPDYPTMDYFPLFKWFWLSALGLFVGQSLFVKGSPNYKPLNLEKNGLSNAIIILGKYSLEIYLLHFIVIYAIQSVLFKKKLY